MIALDTNVLVRYLVEDDAEQARQAAALIRRIVKGDDRVYISRVVVCELVWVLARAYDFTRAEIVETVGRLLGTRHVRLEEPDQVARALAAYEAGRGDLADYLIREQARAEGCDAVATFDRALLREDGFVAP